MRPEDETRILYRMIDANMNRLREGLRVCEDLLRFSGTSLPAVRAIRRIRKTLNQNSLNAFLLRTMRARNIRRDPGSGVSPAAWPERMSRNGVRDLMAANLQRSKESARVLEEAFRALNDRRWTCFKEIRFLLYAAEQKILSPF